MGKLSSALATNDLSSTGSSVFSGLLDVFSKVLSFFEPFTTLADGIVKLLGLLP